MQVLTSANGFITELVFAPDGRALAAAVAYQSPFLWDIPATAAPKPLAEYGRGGASNLAFSPDSGIVSWITRQKRMEFERDTGDEREVQLLDNPNERLNSQVFAGPDSRLIVRTVETSIRFWLRCFMSDGSGAWEEKWFVGPGANLGGVAIAGTESKRFFTWESVVASVMSPRLVARSCRTGELLEATPISFANVYHLAARRDGSEVVAFHNSLLHVWRPGEEPRKIKTGVRTHFRAVAYHPTGSYLLAANNDNTVRVFETTTWSVVKQYTWAIGRLSAVAVSPDGTLAAAGGERGQVVVWDLDL